MDPGSSGGEGRVSLPDRLLTAEEIAAGAKIKFNPLPRVMIAIIFSSAG
jgi:hypothetical protein